MNSREGSIVITKVTILSVPTENGEAAYLAVAGDKHSIGETVGIALDALTSQLEETDNSTVIIVKKMQPDVFFSASQQQEMAQLIHEWRMQRDEGQLHPIQKQQKLEALVESELLASAERANKLLSELEA